jgi:hypothetical protein
VDGQLRWNAGILLATLFTEGMSAGHTSTVVENRFIDDLTQYCPHSAACSTTEQGSEDGTGEATKQGAWWASYEANSSTDFGTCQYSDGATGSTQSTAGCTGKGTYGATGFEAVVL